MTQEKSIDNNLIFTGTCQAGTGVVAAVTGFLASRDCYICALEQFDDESTDKFFMRAVFRPQKDSPAVKKITEDFAVIAESFDMEWKFHRPQVAVKTIILVSKYDHCLDDLLYRRRKGEINMPCDWSLGCRACDGCAAYQVYPDASVAGQHLQH